MGNAASTKVDNNSVKGGGEDPASTAVPASKESHDMGSFDGGGQHDEEEGEHNNFQEEKKELESNNTPRTKTTKSSSATMRNNNKSKNADENNVSLHSSCYITDDQVHVNLAMADLMAYLQVVANNSNHLPLTRRDDPELDRMVTALTADDYARKSAAFIPADVRVIGATFTRYGRVWDLPTSEVCSY